MDVISLNLFYKNSKQYVFTLAPKLHLSTWSRATKFHVEKKLMLNLPKIFCLR